MVAVCSSLFGFGEFVPREIKKSNHFAEYLVIGLLGWLEVIVPVVLFFAYEGPRISGISYNLNYRNAWRGIWIGLLFSNITQMIMWPITFTVTSWELYSAYFKIWLYFGMLGRGLVDFFVSI